MDTNQTYHRSTKKTWLLVTVGVVVASLIVWGYAATFLTVNNTATVNLGAGLTGVAGAGFTSSTICQSQTGYTSSPSITWPIVLTGRTTSVFMCISNVGTDNYPVNISTNLASNLGTISTPQTGTILPVGNFLLVQIDWNVPPGAPLGPVTFNITFQ